MEYSTLISQLRNQVGDKRRRVHVDWIGDGATTVFQMPTDTYPVLDDVNTYVLKVNGSAQVEGTNYELDKDTGGVVFASAPSNNDPVSLDSVAVYLTDSMWLVEINNTIRSLGKDFFKEFVNETDFSLSPGDSSIALAASEPQCMAVYELQFRRSSNEQWQPVEDVINWRYDDDNNTIYLGRNDILGNVQIRIRGLRTYLLGEEVSDVLDVQGHFFTILEYGTFARYWRQRYKDVVELVSKATMENTRTPLQELIMLSDRFDRLYELEKAKLKPQKPARLIPVRKEGGGRP